MDKINIFKIIIVPFLMFSDYYLTIYSNILWEKGYSKYFHIENYELNPLWISDVKKKKLFNIKHLLFVFLSLLLMFLICYMEHKSNYYKLLYGALVTYFSIINFRHLYNIVIFKFINDNPTELNGQISYSSKYVYITSAYQYLVCVGALLPLAFMTRSFYVYGGLISSILLIVIHIGWYRKFKRIEAKHNKKNAPEKVS